MTRKYIIVDRIHVIMFSPSVEHKTEAAGRNVTSAGFFGLNISNGKLVVTCHGYSDSLGITPKNYNLDAKLIERALS